MKIVISSDKYKGTLASATVNSIIEQAINDLQYSNVNIKKCAMADGGDGSLEALTACGGVIKKVSTSDAAFNPIESCYTLTKDGKAIIELASSVGIAILPPQYRNPSLTSTYGLGQVIRKVIEEGCKELVICLGGSATNDAGAGMLQAMGCLFYDSLGKPIECIRAKDLIKTATIDSHEMVKLAESVKFTTLCDVDNPLLGTHGATYTFALQKGADHDILPELEEGVRHFAMLAERHTEKYFRDTAGAGAAGGTSWALMTFCNSKITSGAQYIAEANHIEEEIADADLVITGEGAIDDQTLRGKAAGYIAGLAKQHGKRIVFYCATDRLGLPDTYAMTDYFSMDESRNNAAQTLYKTVCATISEYLH